MAAVVRFSRDESAPAKVAAARAVAHLVAAQLRASTEAGGPPTAASLPPLVPVMMALLGRLLPGKAWFSVFSATNNCQRALVEVLSKYSYGSLLKPDEIRSLCKN